MSLIGNIRIVGYHNDGLTVLVELVKDLEDFVARSGIEVARRLVRQEQPGLMDQCAGDGGALTLTAGEGGGFLAGLGGDADRGHDLVGFIFGLPAARPPVPEAAADHQRQHDIFPNV